MLEKCNNTLWKDVIIAFKKSYENVWSSDNDNYNKMPIWYNNKICYYFNKEWFTKGPICVSDFFISESFITHEYLQNTIGIKCNFLEYANIENKIIKLNIFFNKYNNTQSILRTMLIIINSGGKGCQKIYNVIQKKTNNITIELKNKWEHILKEEFSSENIQKALITQKSPNCI